MAYTAPSSTAVDFIGRGAYTAPLGNATNFDFVVPIYGAVDTGIPFDVSLFVAHGVSGQASERVTIPFAVYGEGSVFYYGSTVAELTFVGEAVLDVPLTAAAQAALSFSITATGVGTVVGQSAVTLTFTATARSTALIEAVAHATLSLYPVVAGVLAPISSAVAHLSINATATGIVAPVAYANADMRFAAQANAARGVSSICDMKAPFVGAAHVAVGKIVTVVGTLTLKGYGLSQHGVSAAVSYPITFAGAAAATHLASINGVVSFVLPVSLSAHGVIPSPLPTEVNQVFVATTQPHIEVFTE